MSNVLWLCNTNVNCWKVGQGFGTSQVVKVEVGKGQVEVRDVPDEVLLLLPSWGWPVLIFQQPVRHHRPLRHRGHRAWGRGHAAALECEQGYRDHR